MIAYEDLCTALDRYNRRLRGEVVPEENPQHPADAEELDIMEESELGSPSQPPPHPAFGASYGSGVPDITAETVLPEGGYGQGAHPPQRPPGSGPVAAPSAPFPGGQAPYRQ